MASQTTLLGAAGEYHIMSQLLRRGYIAALAPTGVPNADIVVTNIEGNRLCSIQVKTRRNIGSDNGWHMKAKHEAIISDRLFYCFVDFGNNAEDSAKTLVVPSAIVAEAITKSHQSWLALPGKRGQPHKDSDMRRFKPDYSNSFPEGRNPYPSNWLNEYKDAWHMLRIEPTAAPDNQAD